MTRALPIVLVLLAAPALAQDPQPEAEAQTARPPLAAAIWCTAAQAGDSTPGCDVGIGFRIACWHDRYCAVGLAGRKTVGIGAAYIVWRDAETGKSLAFGIAPTALYSLERGIEVDDIYLSIGMTAGFGGGKQ